MSLIAGDNSYVDVSYADAFFADYLFNTPWVNIDTTQVQKEQALITASSFLDSKYTWIGDAIERDPTIKIQWGRSNAYSLCDYHLFEIDEIPESLKEATCIQANYLLQQATDPSLPKQAADKQIIKAKLDVMEVTYEPQANTEQAVIPDGVSDLLKCIGVLDDTGRDWVNAYTQRN